MRFHWIESTLAALDPGEAREFVVEAWRMVVPLKVSRAYDEQYPDGPTVSLDLYKLRRKYGGVHALDILGDPVRRRILELLAEGERAAGDVGDVVQREFGISQPAVSQHLRVLREAGFTTVRAGGTRRLYAVDPEPLAEPPSLARGVPPLLHAETRRAGHRARARPPRRGIPNRTEGLTMDVKPRSPRPTASSRRRRSREGRRTRRLSGGPIRRRSPTSGTR